MSKQKQHDKPSTEYSSATPPEEGIAGFVPRLPDPGEVQRQVAQEILGLQMAERLF